MAAVTVHGDFGAQENKVYHCFHCDYSHEIKRLLFLRRKAMTNIDSILKSRDIILLTKVCTVKAMVFPIAMYRCESWTIKKAEHQKTYAFKLRY